MTAVSTGPLVSFVPQVGGLDLPSCSAILTRGQFNTAAVGCGIARVPLAAASRAALPFILALTGHISERAFNLYVRGADRTALAAPGPCRPHPAQRTPSASLATPDGRPRKPARQ